MMMKNSKVSIKIYCLVIGAGSTGKSTLRARLLNDQKSSLPPTMDYEVTTRIQIQKKSYTTTITSGSDGGGEAVNRRLEIVYIEFPGLPIYQCLVEEFVSKRIPHGVPYMIVALFDVTQQSSLSYLEEILNSIGGSAKPPGKSAESSSNQTIPKLMIGNKIDLVDKRIVTGTEAIGKATMMKCRLMECSLRNDLSVTDLEQAIIQETAKLNYHQSAES